MVIDQTNKVVTRAELSKALLERNQWVKKDAPLKDIINVTKVICLRGDDDEPFPIGVFDVDEGKIYRINQWGGQYGPKTPDMIPYEIRVIKAKSK